MNKFFIISFLIFFFCIPLSSQTSGTWKTVQIFTGNTNQTTDDFYIKANKWKVVWSAEKINSEYVNIFIGSIKSSSEDKGIGDVFANIMNEDSGSSVFRKKGNYFIEVNSVNCKWKIEVQEYITK